jgi:hypothetical protein
LRLSSVWDKPPLVPPRKRRAAGKAASAEGSGGPTGQAGLRLSAPAEQLREALRIRDELIAKVSRRKASLRAAETAADEAGAKVASVIEPKWARLHGFDDELHQLLDALTTDAARQPRERAALLRLYHSLQKHGMLSRRADWELRTGRASAGKGAGHDEPGGRDGRGGRGGAQSTFEFDDDDDFVPGGGARGDDVASARRPPESQHGGLRALFRRLVEAFHPDRVQDEAEKAERTEVMKDITEAYRRGDLARLLELERRMNDASAADALEDEAALDDADELARRLEALDRSCDELRAQLRELERELRAVRRSPRGAVAREIKRASRAGYDLADLDVVQDLDRAAFELRRMRDAFAAYRDQRLTLLELLSHSALAALRDDDELLDAVTEVARQMLQKERARRAHEARLAREDVAAGAGANARAAADAKTDAQQSHRRRRR